MPATGLPKSFETFVTALDACPDDVLNLNILKARLWMNKRDKQKVQ